jgi:hypothetical protein
MSRRSPEILIVALSDNSPCNYEVGRSVLMLQDGKNKLVNNK